jgi:hypothetical protein
MALTNTKRKKKDAGQVYECIQSFSAYAPDGCPFAPKVGLRVPHDHWARERWPEFFQPAGAPTVGLEVHPGAEAAVANTPEAPAPEPPKLVRCVATLTVDGIVTPDGNFWQTGKTTIFENDQLPASHPIVRRNPKNFEKP